MEQKNKLAYKAHTENNQPKINKQTKPKSKLK